MAAEELAKPEWLDDEFIESIFENDDETCNRQCVIENYGVKLATQNGDNYSSQLFRLTVSYSVMEGDAQSKMKDRSYIVKVMQPRDSPLGEMFEQLGVFKKESCMYAETLPLIQETVRLTGQEAELGPRCLHSCAEPCQLLVLEDLCAAGYSMVDRRTGLQLQHAHLALDKLGKMHAASMYWNRKSPSFRKTYNKGGFFEGMPTELSQYYKNGVDQALEVMRSLPRCQRFVAAFEALGARLIEAGIRDCATVPDYVDEYNVLNHGDFWLNNMMFKYNHNGEPTDVKFVDFQMSTFNSPGYDLNYFFMTSLQEHTRSQHRRDLLQVYQSSLEETLLKLNHKGFIPSLDQLQHRLLQLKDIALMTCCIVLPLVKLDIQASDGMTTEGIMDSAGSSSRGALYSNQLFQDALCLALEHLEDIGFITDLPPRRMGRCVRETD